MRIHTVSIYALQTTEHLNAFVLGYVCMHIRLACQNVHFKGGTLLKTFKEKKGQNLPVSSSSATRSSWHACICPPDWEVSKLGFIIGSPYWPFAVVSSTEMPRREAKIRLKQCNE